MVVAARMAVLGLVAILSVGGCSAPAAPPSESTSSASGTQAPTRPADPSVIIDFGGFGEVRVGASMANMVADGTVITTGQACGPTFVSIPYASPVFDGDRLVLVWAYPPLRTPEGVMVGTPIDTARQAYPAAVELTPPAGSEKFPGLLVPGGGDKAYLLLHDAGVVQKLIVGLEQYARRLFDSGFGTC